MSSERGWEWTPPALEVIEARWKAYRKMDEELLPDPDAAAGRPVPGAGDLEFRWLPLRGLTEDAFHLPVDRWVARRFLSRP